MNDEVGARPDFQPITTTDIPTPDNPVVVDRLSDEVIPIDTDPVLSPDIEALYRQYSRELGRIAFLLTTNIQDAEDVVGEVFLQMIQRYDIRTIDDPLAFLRTAVVNRSRSVLRRRVVQDKALSKLVPGTEWDTTTESVLGAAENSVIVQALRALPLRQRQAIVLRYYVDLSEFEIAKAMGVRPGSVKSHASRGIAALRRILGPHFEEL